MVHSIFLVLATAIVLVEIGLGSFLWLSAFLHSPIDAPHDTARLACFWLIVSVFPFIAYAWVALTDVGVLKPSPNWFRKIEYDFKRVPRLPTIIIRAGYIGLGAIGGIGLISTLFLFGEIEEREGRYFETNHGKVVRECSKEEFLYSRWAIPASVAFLGAAFASPAIGTAMVMKLRLRGD
jgi:hypothetical protein